MRITEVVPWYPPHLGGVEIVSQSLSLALSRKGHEVSVVTAAPGAGSLDWDGGIRVRRCSAIEIARTPIAPGMPFRLALLDADIIHLHISQAFVPEVAWLVAALKRVPLVAHFHMDVPATRYKRVFDAYKVRVLGPILRQSAAVVALSEEQSRFLTANYGVAPDAIKVIPNGADPRFVPAGGEKAWHNPRRILFVGRLSPQKNVGRLLRACARLPFAYRLSICGEGVERASLEAEAVQLGVESVDFNGRLAPEDLLQRYLRSDLLVSSSDHEGMPLAILEAMATGLPVLATDVPGNRETVRGVGLLVAPTDHDLAVGMEAALQDEVLWRRLSEQSLLAAAGRSWEGAAAALERVFLGEAGEAVA